MARGPRVPKTPRHHLKIQREMVKPATAAPPPGPTPNWWGRRTRNEKIAIGVGGGAVVGGAGLVALRSKQKHSDVEKVSNRQAAAIGAGALAGGAAGEVGGRKVGHRRYAAGKPRPTVMRYGSIDRGWQSARRADVGKASYTAEGTNVVRLTARTPSGRFVSHENDLDVFHVTPRRNPTSRLAVYHKEKRGVGKAMKMPAGGANELRRKLARGESTNDFAGRVQQAKARRGTGVGRKLTG